MGATDGKLKGWVITQLALVHSIVSGDRGREGLAGRKLTDWSSIAAILFNGIVQ
jgi:hypothetical protein